ncbi:hypothetical protein QJQ45_001594 [Haematococcus lacustris]|nr:hypothetical protein QJQ45_001594 [Haematococcus lacustris]
MPEDQVRTHAGNYSLPPETVSAKIAKLGPIKPQFQWSGRARHCRRYAVGPGPRPTELCYWTNRPAMPKPGQPGQEWVEIPDKPLLLKWQRKLQQ